MLTLPDLRTTGSQQQYHNLISLNNQSLMDILQKINSLASLFFNKNY